MTLKKSKTLSDMQGRSMSKKAPPAGAAGDAPDETDVESDALAAVIT